MTDKQNNPDPIADAARLLRETAAIKGVFAMMHRIAVAVVGVGAISESAMVFREGFIEAAELEKIRAQGAVGTICARFFGRDGQPVGTAFDDRTLSIGVDELKRAPIRIAAAISPSKALAMRAAIEGGIINAVATDAETARTLIGG